jgi:hypothetical protein
MDWCRPVSFVPTSRHQEKNVLRKKKKKGEGLVARIRKKEGREDEKEPL